MYKRFLILCLLIFSLSFYAFADNVFVNSSFYVNTDSVHFIVLDIKNTSSQSVGNVIVLVEAYNNHDTLVFSSARNLSDIILPRNHIGVRVPISSDIAQDVYYISARIIDYKRVDVVSGFNNFMFSPLSIEEKTKYYVNCKAYLKNMYSFIFEYCIVTLYIYDENCKLLYVDYCFTDTLFIDENKLIEFSIPNFIFDAMSYYEIVGYSNANKK